MQSDLSPRGPLRLVRGRVVFPDGIRDDVQLVIESGRIIGVEPEESPSSSAVQAVDVGGRLITAGLIDLHVHGAGGRSFEAPESTGHVLRTLAEQGVTSVQASLTSSHVPALVRSVDAICSAAAASATRAANLVGVHLEGPFLAASQCGAHDPRVLQAPRKSDVNQLLEVSDSIGMMTLAPELPGAIEATRRFAEQGIVVAAGHSNAEGADLSAAMDAGLTHITHLWSGQSSTTRRGPWRVPGLLEESLASDRLTAEVIADGKHLPPALLEIARRCLGERLIVVSDGTAGISMPDGFEYDLGTVRCRVGEGVGLLVDSDAFGGSTTALPTMLRHLHMELGWPLVEVIAAMTSRPAQIANISHSKGSIAPGLDADLVIFNDDLTPWRVMVAGHWI